MHSTNYIDAAISHLVRATLAGSVLLTASLMGYQASNAGELPATVDIGVLLPLTGNAGFIGEGARRAFEIFLADYETRRGDEGLPKINPIFIDSQADARIGFQGYQLLSTRYHPKVVFLTYTNVAKAAAPQAIKDQTAMLNMTQGPVTRLGKNFTSILPAYTTQGDVIVGAAASLGVKTLAIIYENSEAFVILANDTEAAYGPKHGIKVVSSEQLPAGATDVSAQATAALAKSPDGVFLLGIAPQIIPLARELRARGFKGQILATADLQDSINLGEGKLFEAAIYPRFWFDEKDPATVHLDEVYRAKFDSALPQFGLLAYKAGQVIEQTLNGLKERKLDWTGDNFVAVQKELTYHTVSGDIQFLADGRVVEPLVLTRVVDGAPTAVRQISREEQTR